MPTGDERYRRASREGVASARQTATARHFSTHTDIVVFCASQNAARSVSSSSRRGGDLKGLHALSHDAHDVSKHSHIIYNGCIHRAGSGRNLGAP